MKKHLAATINGLTIISLLFFYNCQQPKKTPTKFWLGKALDFEQLIPQTKYYHMFDSTGTKVGSMVFSTAFENGLFIARDTSQFDDGSVYETAEFRLDTASMETTGVTIHMSMGNRTELFVDLEKENDRIIGMYSLKKDSLINQGKIPLALLLER